MMKTLTVFTPTYNRAYCLHQLYESLCRQTSKDFEWLVIDDGSTDNTKELIDIWKLENNIEIKYFYKENGGMHTGHNVAYSLIETELNVCIDSDDYMLDNAVEKIIKRWQTLYDKSKICGIIGLNQFSNGNLVGTALPDSLEFSTLYNLYHNLNVKGDKKLVLSTKVVKEYPPYPVFKDERFVPLGTLYLMIDQDYQFSCLNDTLCVVEYLQDGSTRNIFKQYRKNPRGFRYSRIVELTFFKNKRLKILKILHLISSTIFIGDRHFFKDNPEKIMTILLLPLGLLFHFYILIKSYR